MEVTKIEEMPMPSEDPFKTVKDLNPHDEIQDEAPNG
jgi:hypothetical protein